MAEVGWVLVLSKNTSPRQTETNLKGAHDALHARLLVFRGANGPGVFERVAAAKHSSNWAIQAAATRGPFVPNCASDRQGTNPCIEPFLSTVMA
jgi:hypothetical protein